MRNIICVIYRTREDPINRYGLSKNFTYDRSYDVILDFVKEFAKRGEEIFYVIQELKRSLSDKVEENLIREAVDQLNRGQVFKREDLENKLLKLRLEAGI